eukprot:SM000199S05400  [mRNA]  locus=s199:58301:59556:- [translate_table: standard]
MGGGTVEPAGWQERDHAWRLQHTPVELLGKLEQLQDRGMGKQAATDGADQGVVELSVVENTEKQSAELQKLVAGLEATCNGEAHVEYGGEPVRWGLTHLTETVAECCMACSAHAADAAAGARPCNIWVYCPLKGGCYSPGTGADASLHKHKQCWLKQATKPQVLFAGAYPPDFVREHPDAPPKVQWVSGVLSAPKTRG